MAVAGLRYLAAYEVVICIECQTCLLPGRSSQERHLRQPPHSSRGPQLQALLDLLVTYQLQAPNQVALPFPPSPAIEGLRYYDAFACSLCTTSHLTRSRHAL
ncbi:uncharacterized protein LY89DRAFT_749500 [Mollisia scopiformis]|uniref:C2H2-type domain-containing protein n=1 Tax=Mollisia scopiformis TaxID=149040 RepID=A0A194X911_MOLSC|nr:uncharacterized protein LY89DRAFT_749500 [Mollisia scopiformis]KUJ16656.1 hypothetical protein LY89DRAFT_749500 [Mollisia scopiformis]